MNIILTLALASSIITVTRKSRLFGFAIFLLVWTVILLWIDLFDFFSFSGQLASLTLALYLGMLILTFSRYILTARIIDSSLISAALCLYLLLGILWGTVFCFLDAIHPGSFSGDLLAQASTPIERLQYFQYFSFVTLTTLGYGDILPQTRGATALCQTEAVLGQFFMTVLVARLVGIQVTQQVSCDSGRHAASLPPEGRDDRDSES